MQKLPVLSNVKISGLVFSPELSPGTNYDEGTEGIFVFISNSAVSLD